MNVTGTKRGAWGGVVFAVCVAMSSPGTALIIPGSGGGTSTTPPPAPQSGFNCNSLRNVKQYDTIKMKLDDIQYCIGQGFAPPKDWQRAPGGINEAEVGSIALTSRCPPRPAECKGFQGTGGGAGGAPYNPNLTPRTNINTSLNIPPFRPPVNGRVKMPCGGSMALDINSLINSGGQFINNVRFGNVSGAVSTGLQIASGLLSPCNGGILGMIQGAINMVMPAGCTVNITSGMGASCSGSVLSIPAGVTMNLSTNGQLTFPDGGSFRDSLGATVNFASNSTVRVTGSAPNMTVTVTDQTGTVRTYNAGNVPTVDITPGSGGSNGGTVLVPEGTPLPVDPNSSVLPASTP